jgi:hypothetical protein
MKTIRVSDDDAAMLISLGRATEVLPVMAPVATELFDSYGLLARARMLGNVRIDPVVQPGTLHTVTLPVTGHVLSVARPDLKEMLLGYIQRVSEQAAAKAEEVQASIGELMLGTAHLFAPDVFQADGSNWPLAADRYLNPAAYGMAPTIVQALDTMHGSGAIPATSLIDRDDLLALQAIHRADPHSTYRILAGSQQEINAVLSVGGINAAEVTAFDLAAYKARGGKLAAFVP